MAGRLVILRGYPGSGKSTFTNELIHRDSSTVIVSLDDIRVAMAGSKLRWHNMCDKGDRRRQLENIIVRLAHDARSRFLDLGFTVISDATHLNQRSIVEELDQAERHDADATVVCIGENLALGELKDRNLNRDADDRLPVEVLESMWSRNHGLDVFSHRSIRSTAGIVYPVLSSIDLMP